MRTACVLSTVLFWGLCSPAQTTGNPIPSDAHSAVAAATPATAVPGGAAVQPVPAASTPSASPSPFDWGHVRAYFTAGAMTSQERDQFSHQDLFLAFRLDKAYWVPTTPDKDGAFTSGLHTYFETRMTALPVAVQSCNPSTTSTSCSSATNSSNSGSSADPSTTTQTFLNSQKSARLQFGAFYPLYFQHWVVNAKSGDEASQAHYGLFIAPLVETGFDTSMNGLNQTQQQSSTSSQVQPIGGSSQFYKFYDYGVRLGHDRLSTDSGSAPEEMSYLNVGWGRFSNLASLLCPTAQYKGNNTCGAPSGTLHWQRDLRLRVEGLLQVPGTGGFSVGFSTNVSYYKKGQSGNVHIEPADDLRFLLGYKFDVAKLFDKLPKL
jgi:hypothetical protein